MVELNEIRENMHFSSEWEFEYNPNNCVLTCKEKDFLIYYAPEHMIPQAMEMLRLLHRIYPVIICSYQQLKEMFVQDILHIKMLGGL